MLHLNRFETDYETWENKKVNSKFTFPMELDLWPHTVWGLSESEGMALGEAPPPRSDFQYELVGIVVHTGTAQMGHYYSYCRERGTGGPAPSDRWLCMNDSNVTSWAPTVEALEEDCFGGKKTTQFFTKIDKESNGFVLFYERAQRGGGVAAAPLRGNSAL